MCSPPVVGPQPPAGDYWPPGPASPAPPPSSWPSSSTLALQPRPPGGHTLRPRRLVADQSPQTTPQTCPIEKQEANENLVCCKCRWNSP